MGWEDIKEMPTANLREELLALFAKEAEYAHHHPPAPGADDDGSGAAIRQRVCQWNYEYVDHFRVDREVVHLSLYYFDRYLAARGDVEGEAPPSLSEELSQVLALASLYVACKRQGAAAATASSYNDMDKESARLRFRELCGLLRGACGQWMIEGMELSLLATLRWRLHPPTPADFLRQFAKLLSMELQEGSSDNNRHDSGGGWSAFELAQYQIELASYSPELCHRWPPSAVALAAVLNAVDARIVGTERTAIPSHVRRSFLQRLRRVGSGRGGDDTAVSVQRTRVVLQRLCPKTIVLTRQKPALDGQNSPPPTSRAGDVAFTPILSQLTRSLLEYELPASTSPVGGGHQPSMSRQSPAD